MNRSYMLHIVLAILIIGGLWMLHNEYYAFKEQEDCSLDKWNMLVSTVQNPLEFQLEMDRCKVGKEPRTKGMSWGVNLQNIADLAGIDSTRFNKLATMICKAKQYEPTDKMAFYKDLSTFVRDFNVDLRRSELCKDSTTEEECFSKFKTMDDFFSRDINRDILRKKIGELKEIGVNGSNTIVSPADNYCMMFQNENDAKQIWIKGKQFSVMSMIGNQTLYRDTPVSIIINRLAPGHYHKFHCPISGKVTSITRLGTNYLSVQPAIVQQQNVYTDNVRVICQISTKQFGVVSMVIVGASCVGSIRLDGIPSLQAELMSMTQNNEISRILTTPISINSGQLLGSFHYGGSTIVLVFPYTSELNYNPYILNASKKGVETEINVLEPLVQI